MTRKSIYSRPAPPSRGAVAVEDEALIDELVRATEFRPGVVKVTPRTYRQLKKHPLIKKKLKTLAP